MTNVNAAGKEVAPLGGAANNKARIVYATGAKAAQNDTLTLTNCSTILWAHVMVTDTTTKVVDTYTITEATPTKINLTGATTGTVHVVAVVI